MSGQLAWGRRFPGLNKENPGAPIAEFQEGVSGDCGEDIFWGQSPDRKDFVFSKGTVRNNCGVDSDTNS